MLWMNAWCYNCGAFSVRIHSMKYGFDWQEKLHPVTRKKHTRANLFSNEIFTDSPKHRLPIVITNYDINHFLHSVPSYHNHTSQCCDCTNDIQNQQMKSRSICRRLSVATIFGSFISSPFFHLKWTSPAKWCHWKFPENNIKWIKIKLGDQAGPQRAVTVKSINY